METRGLISNVDRSDSTAPADIDARSSRWGFCESCATRSSVAVSGRRGWVAACEASSANRCVLNRVGSDAFCAGFGRGVTEYATNRREGSYGMGRQRIWDDLQRRAARSGGSACGFVVAGGV